MAECKKIKAALLGLGTVGGGVYKLVQRQKEEMVKKSGANLEITRILVHNMNKQREGVDASLLTDNWKEIVEDPEISIVIEVMGGIEPANYWMQHRKIRLISSLRRLLQAVSRSFVR